MFAKKKPLTLFRHPGLYLEQLQDKGRGVFCLEDLKKDETLEVAPVIIIPSKQYPHLALTLIYDYAFSASAFPEKFLKAIGMEDAKSCTCLPLGITSICNHMIDPNAQFNFEVDDLSPYVILKTKRDIVKGEEISVSYGASWFAHRKLSPATR